MSATAPLTLPCPGCGERIEWRDWKAHVAHCDVAERKQKQWFARAERGVEETYDEIDDRPESAYSKRIGRERMRLRSYRAAEWDREIAPALDVWTNEGGKP